MCAVMGLNLFPRPVAARGGAENWHPLLLTSATGPAERRCCVEEGTTYYGMVPTSQKLSPCWSDIRVTLAPLAGVP